MDLRLVEYLTYLAVSIPLTLWVGQALQRSGARFLADALPVASAEAVNRLLGIGFYLVGLGGVALLLQVDGALLSAADVVRAVATKVGLVLLLLGGLHMVNMLILHRLHHPEAAEPPQLQRASGRWP